MFVSLENTLINLDSIACIEYVQRDEYSSYILFTYQNGKTERLDKKDGKSVWSEFQYIRQKLLRKDCLIPCEGEINDAN